MSKQIPCCDKICMTTSDFEFVHWFEHQLNLLAVEKENREVELERAHTKKISIVGLFYQKYIRQRRRTDKKKSGFLGGLKRTSQIWVLIPFSPKYSTVTKASSLSDSLSIVHPTSRLMHMSRYPDAFSVENLWNKSMQIEMKATHMWTYWSHVQARSQQSFKVLLNWWAM